MKDPGSSRIYTHICKSELECLSVDFDDAAVDL